MIIDCISDLHGEFPQLEGGDLLLIAGDCALNDYVKSWKNFYDWLHSQNYRKKIYIAGNHDNFLTHAISTTDPKHEWIKHIPEMMPENQDAIYICDSGTEFEGLKIWGSPWSLWFDRINPKCKAFTGSEIDLRKKWLMIPRDIDILITHTPPYGIFDGIENWQTSLIENTGSVSLRDMILDGSYFPKLKLHVFGHIHEHGESKLETTLCTFVNASHVDKNYKPVNKPIKVIL